MRMKAAKAFVDYYAANNISPVSQDISDFERHLQRRSSLLRVLGVPPSYARGRRVIEFGPGSGHNAVHMARLEPAEYVLVDGNTVGLEQVRANLAAHAPACRPRIEHSLIEEFPCGPVFDLVLCEGVIPFQNDPAAITRKVAACAAPGGVVVITTVDSVSCLADLLRKIYGQAVLYENRAPLDEQAQLLLPVFKPHLDCLPAMSRLHKDWILDTVLQPFVGHLYSMAQALDTLADGFTFHGSSPAFMTTDWRWYKSLHGAGRDFNARARQSYLENAHNLLDHRFTWPARSAADNALLLEHGDMIYKLCMEHQFQVSPKVLLEVAEHVEVIAGHIADFAAQTTKALRDFSAGVSSMDRGGKPADLGEFCSFWGRGQQYMAFLRNDPGVGL